MLAALRDQTADPLRLCLLAALEDDYTRHRKYSPVWRNVAKIARAVLLDATDWHDKDAAHDYVVRHLGRVGDRTLLGEIFPLPVVSRAKQDWCYGIRWATR